MTEQAEMARKFRRTFPETNFMTPEVLRYVKKGPYICELSCGDFMREKIFGVTVISENGSKCDDLNSCFYSEFDAANYINGLPYVREK